MTDVKQFVSEKIRIAFSLSVPDNKCALWTLVAAGAAVVGGIVGYDMAGDVGAATGAVISGFYPLKMAYDIAIR